MEIIHSHIKPDLDDNLLTHYGVKGMKWGVRKKRDSDAGGGSSAAAPKGKAEVDPTKSSTYGSMAKNARARGKFVDQWKEPYGADPPSPSGGKKTRGQKAAAKLDKKADVLQSKLDGVNKDGLKAKAISDKYGPAVGRRSEQWSDRRFKLVYGQSKANMLKTEKGLLKAELDQTRKNADIRRSGKLTPEQKRKIAAGIVVGGLAAYGGYKLYQANRAYAPGDPISPFAFQTKVGQSQMKNWMGESAMTRAQYDKLSDIDLELPAGTTFQRIAGRVESGVSDAAYATFSSEDNDRYKSFFTKELAGRGEKTFYTMAIGSNEPMRSPSAKKRVDLYAEYLEKAGGVHRAVQERTARDVLGDSTRWQEITSKDIALKNYNTFVSAQGSKGQDTLNFFELVRSKGYNMITDDMDAGIIGDNPVILLKPRSLETPVATPLTKAGIKEAGQRLVELKERK